jgi:hypothetical protein
MIVQNPVDLQKLNYIKERIEERPLIAAFTQPLPRRIRPRLSPSNTITSPPSELTNSVANQTRSRQNQLSVTSSIETSKTNQNDTADSELSVDLRNKKSLKNRLKVKQHSQSSERKYKIDF